MHPEPAHLPSHDPTEQQRLWVAAQMTKQVESNGLQLEDLLRLRETGSLPGHISLADYIPVVRAALAGSTRSTWDSYFAFIAEGAPEVCGCICPPCLDAYAQTMANRNRKDPSARVAVPCPCTNADCTCPRSALELSGADSCAERFTGLGKRPLARITVAELRQAMRWAKIRGGKHWQVRNRHRIDNMDPRNQHLHDGRTSGEHVRTIASVIWKLAVSDPDTGVQRNIVTDIPKVRRKEIERRALEEDQLKLAWQAVFTSGSNDVELDMLIVWLGLETGARRGGGINLLVGDLDYRTAYGLLREKGGTTQEQPMSPELVLALLGHAIERGDVIQSTVDGLAHEDVTLTDLLEGRATLRKDAPVLYYKRRKRATREEEVIDTDGTPRKVIVKLTDADGRPRMEPRPLTRKRYETLTARLQRHLSGSLSTLRPHDFRRTGATFIERAFGYAVSQGWLRHSLGGAMGRGCPGVRGT